MTPATKPDAQTPSDYPVWLIGRLIKQVGEHGGVHLDDHAQFKEHLETIAVALVAASQRCDDLEKALKEKSGD